MLDQWYLKLDLALKHKKNFIRFEFFFFWAKWNLNQKKIVLEVFSSIEKIFDPFYSF